jgi:hypothetical protein
MEVLHNLYHNLQQLSLPVGTHWFMQDGARLHIANVALDFMHAVFTIV